MCLSQCVIQNVIVGKALQTGNMKDAFVRRLKCELNPPALVSEPSHDVFSVFGKIHFVLYVMWFLFFWDGGVSVMIHN